MRSDWASNLLGSLDWAFASTSQARDHRQKPPHLDNFYRSYFLPFWRGEVYLGEGASFEEYGSNFISSQITKQLFQPIMRSLILLLGLQMPFYHILTLNINLSIFFNVFKIH